MLQPYEQKNHNQKIDLIAFPYNLALYLLNIISSGEVASTEFHCWQ